MIFIFKEMEERFTQERKLIVENNSTQNKRQLDFIDQLIKDKQSLGEFYSSISYTVMMIYSILYTTQ